VSDHNPALSVLDLVPVRSDQSTTDALAATRRLARVADGLGFRRYWLAEHHNMPAVAATNPPVLVAMVAAATERIRVGSGGVMLPNHAPLVVAEQFALLEAAHPGRIDLGIGRAPGTDPVTAWALRHGGGGVEDDAVAHFPEYVDNIAAMLSPGGVGIRLSGGTHVLRATPHATSAPGVWLLGSSDYSARLAAEKGLPYVFAHHFSGRGTAEALALYRDSFQPSTVQPEPRTARGRGRCEAPSRVLDLELKQTGHCASADAQGEQLRLVLVVLDCVLDENLEGEARHLCPLDLRSDLPLDAQSIGEARLQN